MDHWKHTDFLLQILLTIKEEQSSQDQICRCAQQMFTEVNKYLATKQLPQPHFTETSFCLRVLLAWNLLLKQPSFQHSMWRTLLRCTLPFFQDVSVSHTLSQIARLENPKKSTASYSSYYLLLLELEKKVLSV